MLLVVAPASAQVPAAGVTPCPGGREINADTAGHCCWSGQAWNGARCVGAPVSCPPGFQNDARTQECVMLACDAGKKRQADLVHCCWPGQAYSRVRNVCVGTPKCPPQMEPTGTDDCQSADRDGDGIPNALDKCPDQPEDKNGFEDSDGCPDEQKRVAMIAAETDRKQREVAVNAVHPLETLGGARYVGGFGFLLPGSPPDAPPPEAAAAEQPVTLPAGKPLSRTDWQYGLDIAYVHWSDSTIIPFDVGLFGFGLWLRPEFRAIGRWVTPWLDLRVNGGISTSATVGAGGSYSVASFGGNAHFGLDAQPWNFLGIGPYAGYRGDYATVSPSGGSGGNNNQSWNASDSGLEFGLHVRARTLDSPDRVSLFYYDGEIFSRAGSVMSGIYNRDEIGVRASEGFTVYLAAEVRLSESGTPGPGDIQNISDLMVKTASSQSRLSLGVGGAF
jgi:hypothetical protein